jgi:hypothetical protein
MQGEPNNRPLPFRDKIRGGTDRGGANDFDEAVASGVVPVEQVSLSILSQGTAAPEAETAQEQFSEGGTRKHMPEIF